MWAVVCSNCDRAAEVIKSIEESCDKEVFDRRRNRNHIETRFTDGTIIKWVKPLQSSRGYRFDKLWCDRDIDWEIFWDVIIHSYLGKREDIIWL